MTRTPNTARVLTATLLGLAMPSTTAWSSFYGPRSIYAVQPMGPFAPTYATLSNALDLMHAVRPRYYPDASREANALAQHLARRTLIPVVRHQNMFQELNQVFDGLIGQLESALPASPSFEVHRLEDGTGYALAAQGLAPQSVQVEVDNDLIKIKATTADGTVHLMRTMQLPSKVVDATKITAEALDDKFSLTIPDAALATRVEPVKANILVKKNLPEKAASGAHDTAKAAGSAGASNAAEVKVQENQDFEITDAKDDHEPEL